VEKGDAYARRRPGAGAGKWRRELAGSRSPHARRREHAFKAVVHDLMLSRRESQGSRQGRTYLV